MQTSVQQHMSFGIKNSCSSFFQHVLWGMAFLVTMVSCSKELDLPVVYPLETGALSASKTQVVINASLPSDTAVFLKWEAYANPLIKNTVVFTSGSLTDSVAITGNSMSKLFSNSELNGILVDQFKLPVGTETEISVHVYAVIPTNGKTAESNVITLKVTPAKVGPAFSKLGIVGDATPNGWDIQNSNVMYVDPYNPYIFRYNEVLKAGEFKIPTVVGGDAWDIPYYRPLTNDPDISITTVTLSDKGGPDDKWRITNAGPYKIELDILKKTIKIKPFTAFPQLWIVGNATPDNWNIASPTPMVPTVGNPYEFTYTGALNAGEFKIPTTTGNWSCTYFRPAVNHPALNDTNAAMVENGGDPADTNDYKWQISTAGNYKITLNQLYETILIEKL